MKEGQVADERELHDAHERVRLARVSELFLLLLDWPPTHIALLLGQERFNALKHEHSALVEQANELGRCGFPEVWRGVGYVFRGGSLLTVDSFTNLKWLRSPDVRVGEKDGRAWVLKSRVISDKKERSKFEKVELLVWSFL